MQKNTTAYSLALLFITLFCTNIAYLSYHSFGNIRGTVVLNKIAQLGRQTFMGGELRTSNKMISLAKGLHQVREWTPLIIDKTASSKEIEIAFHKFINRVDLLCLSRMRLGRFGDGGWDICLAGPYDPKKNHCLVYSFGIGNDWSFDDAAANKYGCLVRAFDPTMSKYPNATKRGKKVFFYPIGIHGNDTKVKNGRGMVPVKTLGSLRKKFKEEKKVIDYLKMDVEGSEWPALEAMFMEGFLSKYVKQIGIEYHSFGKITNKWLSVLERLEELGFRKWNVHWNMHCIRKSQIKLNVTSCHEVYYLNLNFLQKKVK